MSVKLFFLFTNKIGGVVPLNVLVTLLETVLLVLVLCTQFRSSENKIERTCNVWSFWNMELYYWKWWCKFCKEYFCGFGKKNSRHSENESAKLCALRALVPTRLTHSWYAPYVPACLCALPIINTHLRALCALRAYRPYVPLSCLVLCYYNWKVK